MAVRGCREIFPYHFGYYPHFPPFFFLFFQTPVSQARGEQNKSDTAMAVAHRLPGLEIQYLDSQSV